MAPGLCGAAPPPTRPPQDPSQTLRAKHLRAPALSAEPLRPLRAALRRRGRARRPTGPGGHVPLPTPAKDQKEDHRGYHPIGKPGQQLPRLARGGHRAGGGRLQRPVLHPQHPRGDQHVDATGYTWSEATPSALAIAHVITAAHEAEPDTWSSASRQHYIDTGEYLRAAETEAQR